MPSSDIAGVPRMVDEDYLIRRIEAIERAQRELGPSVMAAVATALGDATDALGDAAAAASAAALAASDATDALALAVTFATAHSNASAFAIPAGGIGATSIVEATVTVPTGYTYAGIMASGFIAAKNTTAGALNLQAVIEIDNHGDDLTQVSVPAGGVVPITAIRAYHGAVDGTVTINLKAGSSSAWSSTAANWAMLSALVTFRKTA